MANSVAWGQTLSGSTLNISGTLGSDRIWRTDSNSYLSGYTGNFDQTTIATYDIQNSLNLSYVDVQSGGVNIGSSEAVTLYQGSIDSASGYVSTPNGVYLGSAYSALFSQGVGQTTVVGWASSYTGTGSLSTVNGLIADSTGTVLQSATALTLTGSTISLTGATSINTTGNASTSIGGSGTGSVTITSGANSLVMGNTMLAITAPTTIVGTTLINTTGTASTTIGNTSGTVTVSGAAVNLGTNSGSVVTVGSNSANSTVSLNGNRLQNVGTGTEGTDAVNLNQLNSLTTTSSSQLTSLQSQVTGLQSQIYVNERGIAGVSAIANVPSLFVGQKFNVGLGFGAFNANTALALGANWRLQDNLIAKISASISANTYVTGAGISLGF